MGPCTVREVSPECDFKLPVAKSKTERQNVKLKAKNRAAGLDVKSEQ
jgi:hypothetical protein